MTYTSERLGELLVGAGLITEAQLGLALAEQSRAGGKLGEVLVRDLILTEDQIAEALAGQKGLTHVNLAAVEIDPTAAMMLPLRMARRKSVIPISLHGDVVTLAMADPLDVQAIDEVEMRTGLRVEPVVASSSQVRYAIEKYIAGTDALLGLEAGESREPVSDAHDVGMEGDVPVVRMVNQLLREAVAERVSDIHFEPGPAGVRVRYRVDGVLRDVASLPQSAQPELLSRLKVMAELDITERRRPQDGRISMRIEGKSVDLRMATLPTAYGESMVLRLLDAEVAFLPLSEIGLGDSEVERLLKLLGRPFGGIFVTGPTGSGKSTTLYALLNEINDPGRKTVTIEDPIEYRMGGVTQIAVNNRVGLTFSNGLRTILRSDPDAVMVGEVRDPETAEIAVRAALTGHLVLTSLHTNDAPSALTRLTDMGVPPYITSSSILGVLAQRLVRRLCPACKAPVGVSEDKLRLIGFSEEEIGTFEVMGPVGCSECSKTGYRGRIGVFELMEFDGVLSELFVRNAPVEDLRKAAVMRGMRTMRRDALDKVKAGVTSLDEMDRVVS